MQTDQADGRAAPAGLGVLVGARADGDPAACAELARLADRLGYREIMIGEATGYDAFAFAVSLGEGPAKLCLGPLPAAVRDPVTTARGAATVLLSTLRASRMVSRAERTEDRDRGRGATPARVRASGRVGRAFPA